MRDIVETYYANHSMINGELVVSDQADRGGNLETRVNQLSEMLRNMAAEIETLSESVRTLEDGVQKQGKAITNLHDLVTSQGKLIDILVDIPRLDGNPEKPLANPLEGDSRPPHDPPPLP